MTRWLQTYIFNIMSIQIDLDKLNIKSEINNGKGQQPLAEENRQLATDYCGMPENGLKMSDLVGKYGSSSQALYERLDRMGVPRHKPQVKKEVAEEGAESE